MQRRQWLVVAGPPPAPLTKSHLSQNPPLQWRPSGPCPGSTVTLPRLPSSSKNSGCGFQSAGRKERKRGDHEAAAEKRQREGHVLTGGTSPVPPAPRGAGLSAGRCLAHRNDSDLGPALEEMPIWWRRQLCKQRITDQCKQGCTNPAGESGRASWRR